MIPAINKRVDTKCWAYFYLYCSERWRMLDSILCVCALGCEMETFIVYLYQSYKVYFSLLLNIMLCRCLGTVKISFSLFSVTCFGLCLFLCMHHFYNIKSKKVIVGVYWYTFYKRSLKKWKRKYYLAKLIKI